MMVKLKWMSVPRFYKDHSQWVLSDMVVQLLDIFMHPPRR